MSTRQTVTLAASFAACVLVTTSCSDTTDARHTPTPMPSASSLHAPTAALIAIDLPAEGANVSVPVPISGAANTFEAVLTVDALNGAGDVLCARTIMATSGSGTPGTWETNLAFPPQDTDVPVTLRAYELSAKDGSVQNLVSRKITVSAKRPPIFLTSPVCGATMTNPGEVFLVAGLATVFEAALTVEFRDASGAVVFAHDLMTEVGNEESGFGEYVTLPADTPAGFYDVVAFNYSPKDGSIENEFSVQVNVQP